MVATSVDDRTIEKWRDLVERLSFATKSKALTWKESSSDGVYLTIISKNIVYFGSADPDDRHSYFIKIQDASGKDVDSFNDQDVDSGSYSNSCYDTMKAMHIDITRHLNGADQVLDSLLAALPKAQPQPQPQSTSGKKLNLDDDIPF